MARGEEPDFDDLNPNDSNIGLDRISINQNIQALRKRATAKDLNETSSSSSSSFPLRSAVFSHSNLKPISIANRSFTHPQVLLLQKIADRLEESGRIEASMSPWNSPLALTPSMFGTSLCLAVDYKNTLNRHTINEEYPPDLVDTLLNCKWEVAYNLDNFSWSSRPIDPSIQDLLAFTIPGRGKYTWRYTPQEKNNYQQFLRYSPEIDDSNEIRFTQEMGPNHYSNNHQQQKEIKAITCGKNVEYSDYAVPLRIDDGNYFSAPQLNITVARATIAEDTQNRRVFTAKEFSQPEVSKLTLSSNEITWDESNDGVAIAAEPQSQKLLNKDVSKNRKVTFRALDLNGGLRDEGYNDQTVHINNYNNCDDNIRTSENIEYNSNQIPELDTFDSHQPDTPSNQQPKQLQPQNPTTMNESKIFRKIEYILGEWFLHFDIHDTKSAVRHLGSNTFNKELLASFFVDSMQSNRASAVSRTAKLVVELLKDGSVVGTDVVSCLSEITSTMKETAAESPEIFEHIATFYGVLMAFDDSLFNLSTLKGLLHPVIEQGHRGTLVAPQILGRVLTFVRILNVGDGIDAVVKRQFAGPMRCSIREFWPVDDRENGEVMRDWAAQHFLDSIISFI
ncbi:UNVERIFIED_CONTAM: hypothetical protein HDU68_008521 [Siphonaria sp. JEL0065]|nr:hypothetical protein HDU68_008521 [Siphonaria sp. JEL0065]